MARLAAALGLANLLVALFFLPRSPGLDELELHTAVYARQHYGRLFYPAYDLPLIYCPTKYWLVAALGMLGVSIRVATAGLFVGSYLVAIGGIFACRFGFFQRLAALTAVALTVTLYPFISYAPENLTYAEGIGRLRPDDLVLTSWLGALFWLEASRRRGWRASYSFVGGVCVGLASVTHWFGLPTLAAAGVYAVAALISGGPRRALRLVPIAAGVALACLPTLVALAPHIREVSGYVLGQAGDPASRALVDVWRRHAADYWFLLQWTERHAGDAWASASLLAGPAWLGIPPVLFAAVILLACPSSHVLGLAGLALPLAVLRVSHKSSGYELPEIAYFLLACGWLLASPLERLGGRWQRLVASGLFLVPLATSTPLVWHPSGLRFMDERNSPELLRAMGRAVIGPGASVVGPFYVSGGDNVVLNAGPFEPGIDFVVEREFHLASGPLHRMYQLGQTRLAGFVLTPEAPSASMVYFTAKRNVELTGFVSRNGELRRFSTAGSGWQLRILRCRASPEELSWVEPRPPVKIAGYVPRTNHCVSDALRTSGLEGRFASVFLRRTWSFDSMAEQVLVPLLIDDAADAASAAGLGQACGCETLERVAGGLEKVPAHWLLEALERTDRTIRFYAGAPDLVAGRDMALRFASGRQD
ncbi:MAG: hypothetical protein ACHP85_00805 [Burkholderiales bacterium]|jgi:uncharacterized membrane protein